MAEPAARRLIVRARLLDQLPESRRVIHPLQVHQLVDDHVVADRLGHVDEPPIEADVAGV
jgi:hypothetical protein